MTRLMLIDDEDDDDENDDEYYDAEHDDDQNLLTFRITKMGEVALRKAKRDTS